MPLNVCIYIMATCNACPSLSLPLSQVQSSLQTSLKLSASDKNPNSRPSPSEEGRERGEGEKAGLLGEAAGRQTAQERLRGFAFSVTSDSAT